MRDTIKKLGYILDKKQKRKIAGLVVMTVISGFLETLSVSLLLPLVSLIIDENAMMENKYVIAICDKLQIKDITTLILWVLLLLIVVFVIKTAYVFLTDYVQLRFINNSLYRDSCKMLEKYAYKPYAYFLNADTAVILRIIYADTERVYTLVRECMMLLTEFVVAFFLGIFLLIVNVKMTVFIMVLLLATVLLIKVVLEPKIAKIGVSYQEAQSRSYKWILEAFNGIKDIKVAEKEEFFIGNYDREYKENCKLRRKSLLYLGVPRLLIEMIAMVGVLIYLIINIVLGHKLNSMIPQISAFGFAAVRLLPSVNRISTRLSNISYYKAALDTLYEDLSEKTKKRISWQESGKKITIKDRIKMENITFSYPNTDKKVLDNANLEIPAGKSVGLIGPSGAGKTTVVDILLGLLDAQEGKLLCDGLNIKECYSAWLNNIGYIPQSIFLLDGSIADNVAFGIEKEKVDEKRLWEVLREAQLAEFVEQLPERENTTIGERGVRLSGGQRQRIGIARALYHDPEILVFDEATSALDNDTEHAIMESIRAFKGKKTMIIIAHRLKTVEECDILYKVEDGKIIRTEI